MVGTPILTVEEEQVDMVLHLNMEDQVDMVLNLNMEEVGSRNSLTEEEEVVLDTNLKLHVLDTVTEDIGIGSCNTVSNLKDMEGATVSLSLRTAVLVHTDKDKP